MQFYKITDYIFMVKLCRIKIYGKVQGVNFRFSTKAKADALDICGMVKNMADGTVYIEAEGRAEALDEFVHWCRTGSPWAKVEAVKVDYLDDLINYQDFKIEY